MLRGQLLRYCLVGVGNTLAHFALLVALVEAARMAPAVANVLAFAAANALSFVMNSRFTFASRLGWGRYLKFLAVSLLGLAINYLTMQLAQALGLHYLAGAAVAIVLVIGIGFGLSRAVVFGRPPRGESHAGPD